MDVPGRISHDGVELAQHPKVEVSEIAIYPLRLGDNGLVDLVRGFTVLEVRGVIVLDVVDMLTLRVQTGVQVRAVPRRLLRIGLNYFSEVPFVADSAPGPGALDLGAVVAVLHIFDLRPLTVLLNKGSLSKAFHLVDLC